jgi:hypothetical protein
MPPLHGRIITNILLYSPFVSYNTFMNNYEKLREALNLLCAIPDVFPYKSPDADFNSICINAYADLVPNEIVEKIKDVGFSVSLSSFHDYDRKVISFYLYLDY